MPNAPLQPLLAVHRATGLETALEPACDLGARARDDPALLPPDGRFPRGSHVHSLLRSQLGLVNLARALGDQTLQQRAHAALSGFCALTTR